MIFPSLAKRLAMCRPLLLPADKDGIAWED